MQTLSQRPSKYLEAFSRGSQSHRQNQCVPEEGQLFSKFSDNSSMRDVSSFYCEKKRVPLID